MKSAYNYLQNENVYSHDAENINLALNNYRKWFLRKGCINYTKLNKGNQSKKLYRHLIEKSMI